MPKLAILDDYADKALSLADWSVLKGVDIAVYNDNLVEPAALAERLKDCEIVCIMRERTPFRREVLEKLPNLKLLVTSGMRNASVDVAAANELGITVCGTGSSGAGVVELCWLLIQAVVRQLPQEDRATRAGRWQTSVGKDLAGRTLGLIGLGRLGGRVAEIANFFNMNVIAWSQNLTDEKAAEFGARRVELDVLMAESDIVSIHLILSKRSRGLIGARELGLMKPDAYLVNTARGPIVDEAALIAALQSGAIAGAALDVFDQEPLPQDHPFLSMDNVILAPHLGYVTEEIFRTFYGQQVEAVAAYLQGEPIRVIAP
tara:strand:- start:404 stop:1354 length:951 start_codon:yes stop_codon:yes gene_type:complete